MRQLATDNQISVWTGYDYLNKGIDVLAARSPSPQGALLAAKAAGHDYVNIDGTLIETDRCRTPGPTPDVDLWWVEQARPVRRQRPGHHRAGRLADLDLRRAASLEHDTTALRAHAEILPALTDAGTPQLESSPAPGE